MTPKRLGILAVALVALWSLVGPVEAPSPLLVPGISGVDIAQAGDPDQYTNKPGSSEQAPQDSLPPPPSEIGGRIEKVASGGTLSAVIQAASVLLWGKGTIY
jgi:hypothetical protein